MSIKPNSADQSTGRGSQSGQTSVFVVVFLGITVLSLVLLYKSGKLTSEKMEMQNAADATAYSVALLEARDLNFMAYTNRAMVANEVAIGQAVGLASMPRNIKGIGHYMHALCGARLEPLANILQRFPPTSTIATFIKTTLCSLGIRRLGDTLIRIGGNATGPIDSRIARPLAELMHKANNGLSQAQTLYHVGTLAYVIRTIVDVVKDNADDVELSPYGASMLMGHMESFGYFHPYHNKAGKFTRTYVPTRNAPEDIEGFERFAAITGASRDEFSKNRGWTFTPPFPLNLPYNRINFPIPNIPFGLGEFRITASLEYQFTTPLSRLGGSELRYVNTPQGNRFNWSSADTDAGAVNFLLGFNLQLCVRIYLDLSGKCWPLTGINFYVSTLTGNLSAGLSLTLPLGLGTISTPPISIPFPLNNPLGAGAAQVGSNRITENLLTAIPNSNNTRDNYGYSPAGSPNNTPYPNAQHKSAWNGSLPSPLLTPWSPKGTAGPNFRCPPPPGITANRNRCTVPIVSKWMPHSRQRIYTGYSGLKQYTDTLKPQDLWGFEGPNIIIGLKKDSDKLFSATAPNPTGQFQLLESMPQDLMGTIAKGEVYFKRTNQLSYFQRNDPFEEQGSAFNPYWQARLAPLTHSDRAVANVQQHGQNMEDSALTPFANPIWEHDRWIR